MDTDKRPAVASGEKKIHLACTVLASWFKTIFVDFAEHCVIFPEKIYAKPKREKTNASRSLTLHLEH